MNPKTYPAFTKATGTTVKKEFFVSNEALQAKLKAGARGYDLAAPTGYMVKILAADDLLTPINWSKLPNVRRNIDPKFRKLPVRPAGSLLGPEGLGNDRVRLPDRQDQGAAEVLGAVLRALREVPEEVHAARRQPRGHRLDRRDDGLLVQHRRRG